MDKYIVEGIFGGKKKGFSKRKVMWQSNRGEKN